MRTQTRSYVQSPAARIGECPWISRYAAMPNATGTRSSTPPRIVEATATIAPNAWRRHLALVLDGLRASAAHPLPVPPITENQLMRALGG